MCSLWKSISYECRKIRKDRNLCKTPCFDVWRCCYWKVQEYNMQTANRFFSVVHTWHDMTRHERTIHCHTFCQVTLHYIALYIIGDPDKLPYGTVTGLGGTPKNIIIRTSYYTTISYIYSTLPKTNSSPLQRAQFKSKQSSSNHFQVRLLLVSGRVSPYTLPPYRPYSYPPTLDPNVRHVF